ncbi:MAG TPA: hypothetical protein DDY89_08845 [Lysinibacillus sp.]|nr:hypothetical protein [Lysinibacillus sp.]
MKTDIEGNVNRTNSPVGRNGKEIPFAELALRIVNSNYSVMWQQKNGRDSQSMNLHFIKKCSSLVRKIIAVILLECIGGKGRP